MLPERCPSETLTVQTLRGQKIHLTLQLDPERDLRVSGVFYAGGFRSGSDMEFTMHDVCIMISILLQHGYEPDQILPKLSPVEPKKIGVESASIIGLIVDEIRKYPGIDL